MDPRDRLFSLAQRSLVGFCVVVAGAGLAVGMVLGPAAEAALLAGVLAWLAWEARPKLYLAMGLHARAADAARRLGASAPGSLRGDLHRLTEAVAELCRGRLDRAKAALARVDPARLPDRARYAYFLDLSVLFLHLGDGEAALAMVEAGQAEAETLRLRWPGLVSINRSAALCESGRFDEAARCLEDTPVETVPPAVRAYFHNNLAWSLGFGSGDKEEALRHAEAAVGLRGQDPACLGTLGMCLVLAGHAPEAALPLLERAVGEAERRSPLGRAMLTAVTVRAMRLVGEERRALVLERELAALPRGGFGQQLLEGAIEARALPS